MSSYNHQLGGEGFLSDLCDVAEIIEQSEGIILKLMTMEGEEMEEVSGIMSPDSNEIEGEESQKVSVFKFEKQEQTLLKVRWAADMLGGYREVM